MSAPVHALSPMRFVRHAISPKTMSTGIAHSGCVPRMTPMVVATPLPPRNPNQGDVMCPITAARPATSPRLGSPQMVNASAGRSPFSTSITPTTTPMRTPITRAALVAPGLPEPDPRRSMRRSRAMSAAGLTEPSR